VNARELPPLEGKVLPFRRPSSAVRFRRKSHWVTLGKPFLQASTLVGLPFALALWLFTSPTFGLTTIEVEGNRYVETAWVEHALAPLAGENLLRLSLPTVESAVAGNPWVARVTIDKRLPDRLRLVVEERRPAALLRTSGALVYLDDAGRTIAPFDPLRGPGDLLLVSVATLPGAELGGAFAIAQELARVAPEWAAGLSEVEVLGESDFRLHLAALDFPLLVRAGTLAGRAPELRRLLPELTRRYGALAFVDLRLDRRIVLQPVDPAPTASAATRDRVRT
jgi:cell division septal protein FtsQ